ncbi:MAG: DUF952 domain-containing protein [Chloroflexi bacterium]|nr:DUF952 domain-containing protein [Chloroflexota bacterium]
MARIFHLISAQDWNGAKGNQSWSPPSLADEGFVHCSKDHDQMFRVMQRLYTDRTDMLALELETDILTHSLVWEPSRSGEVYPHIYGPLNLEAAITVWRVQTDGASGLDLSEETNLA